MEAACCTWPACESSLTSTASLNLLPEYPCSCHLCLQVAAASSATMIVFTAAGSFMVYVSFGLSPWDYAAALMVLGFLATLAGQLAMYRLIQAVGRRSVIVMSMVVLLVIGCALMVYESARSIAAVARHEPGSEKLTAFGSIC